MAANFIYKITCSLSNYLPLNTEPKKVVGLAISEGLNEEALVLFDLLNKPVLVCSGSSRWLLSCSKPKSES
jgi:hypothetical protein